jgi:hypothetical protein
MYYPYHLWIPPIPRLKNRWYKINLNRRILTYRFFYITYESFSTRGIFSSFATQNLAHHECPNFKSLNMDTPELWSRRSGDLSNLLENNVKEYALRNKQPGDTVRKDTDLLDRDKQCPNTKGHFAVTCTGTGNSLQSIPKSRWKEPCHPIEDCIRKFRMKGSNRRLYKPLYILASNITE